MEEEKTIINMLNCKKLNDHEIGRNAITHDGITHASGEQICLKCRRTLSDLILEAEARGKEKARAELTEKIGWMNKDLQDEYTEEEKEFLKKMVIPEKTPEFLQERRYGYNWALSDIIALLQIESLTPPAGIQAGK